MHMVVCFLQVQDEPYRYACWSYIWFWLDLVQLSLQQAGGQPGPAALAAAQQLMKQEHSVFLARYGHLQMYCCNCDQALIHICRGLADVATARSHLFVWCTYISSIAPSILVWAMTRLYKCGYRSDKSKHVMMSTYA